MFETTKPFSHDDKCVHPQHKSTRGKLCASRGFATSPNSHILHAREASRRSPSIFLGLSAPVLGLRSLPSSSLLCILAHPAARRWSPLRAATCFPCHASHVHSLHFLRECHNLEATEGRCPDHISWLANDLGYRLPKSSRVCTLDTRSFRLARYSYSDLRIPFYYQPIVCGWIRVEYHSRG